MFLLLAAAAFSAINTWYDLQMIVLCEI